MLSADEFRDELRDRHFLPLLSTPSHWDGYNSKFSVSHALSCKVGGLIQSRHDESRETISFLAIAGFMTSNVLDKPLIHPRSGSDAEACSTQMHNIKKGVNAEVNYERGDILVRGF